MVSHREKPIRNARQKRPGSLRVFMPKASARETSPKKCTDLFLNCRRRKESQNPSRTVKVREG